MEGGTRLMTCTTFYLLDHDLVQILFTETLLHKAVSVLRNELCRTHTDAGRSESSQTAGRELSCTSLMQMPCLQCTRVMIEEPFTNHHPPSSMCLSEISDRAQLLYKTLFLAFMTMDLVTPLWWWWCSKHNCSEMEIFFGAHSLHASFMDSVNLLLTIQLYIALTR